MTIKAEYISYMNAYRLFIDKEPQQTIAYTDTLEEAENLSAENGYEHLILED